MSEAKSTQNSPYVVEEEPRRIAWCACGLSEKQPYCDGSHKTTDLTPIVVELSEAKKVAWCGCRQSGNKPYCDGTHKNL